MKPLLLLLLIASALWSAPAYTQKRMFKQPDGTDVPVRSQGDEYLNWIETDDGEILLLNKREKQLEYAIIKDKKLKPSGKAFKSPKARNNTPRLHPKITKEELRKLWKEKRKEEMLRRHGER